MDLLKVNVCGPGASSFDSGMVWALSSYAICRCIETSQTGLPASPGPGASTCQCASASPDAGFGTCISKPIVNGLGRFVGGVVREQDLSWKDESYSQPLSWLLIVVLAFA